MGKTTNLRRYAVKVKLIKLHGGACLKCGYDNLNCVAAFDFHHRNKSEKKFNIQEAVNHGRAWYDILEEAKKCDLLCCRCHRELESEQPKIDIEKVYEEFINRRQRIGILAPRSSVPSAGELQELVKQYSIAEIARSCCVSFATIKYWCDKYEIKKTVVVKQNRATRIPRKEELKSLIQNHSAGQVGSMFGVGEKAVSKWLKKYGLKNPRRGIFYRTTKIFARAKYPDVFK